MEVQVILWEILLYENSCYIKGPYTPVECQWMVTMAVACQPISSTVGYFTLFTCNLCLWQCIYMLLYLATFSMNLMSNFMKYIFVYCVTKMYKLVPMCSIAKGLQLPSHLWHDTQLFAARVLNALFLFTKPNPKPILTLKVRPSQSGALPPLDHSRFLICVFCCQCIFHTGINTEIICTFSQYWQMT